MTPLSPGTFTLALAAIAAAATTASAEADDAGSNELEKSVARSPKFSRKTLPDAIGGRLALGGDTDDVAGDGGSDDVTG